jgi:hypothetical protein
MLEIRAGDRGLLFEAEKKHGIRYFFERAVVGADGETRWPDFSIEKSQQRDYWEHCGMTQMNPFIVTRKLHRALLTYLILGSLEEGRHGGWGSVQYTRGSRRYCRSYWKIKTKHDA